MRIKSQLLSVVFATATFPLISVNAAQASEMCTVKTAKQSVSSNTLCACDVVSSRMLKYIQRRADFESILEQTLIDCPGFAAVLTDLPTASIGFAEQRSGDGSDDENRGGGGDGPDGGDNPGNDDDGDDGKDPGNDPDDDGKDPGNDPDDDGKDPKGDKPDRDDLRDKRAKVRELRQSAKEHRALAKEARASGNDALADLQRSRARALRENANTLSESLRQRGASQAEIADAIAREEAQRIEDGKGR